MNYTNSRGPSEKGALDSNGRVIRKSSTNFALGSTNLTCDKQ